jgi:type II secretory pathway component GspD/PulD (secretin)
MFICPQVSEATAGNDIISGNDTFTFRDPETRSTRSMVRVKDGDTVIMGGLIRNEFSETETKLPFLGDIPLMGSFFRHKNKSRDRERELLVFITPHIIRDNNIALAQAGKINLPEREQGNASGYDRYYDINSSLNNLEKKKR